MPVPELAPVPPELAPVPALAPVLGRGDPCCRTAPSSQWASLQGAGTPRARRRCQASALTAGHLGRAVRHAWARRRGGVAHRCDQGSPPCRPTPHGRTVVLQPRAGVTAETRRSCAPAGVVAARDNHPGVVGMRSSKIVKANEADDYEPVLYVYEDGETKTYNQFIGEAA